MKVVHKYGPCSHLNHDNLNLTYITEQSIEQDLFRANYIQSLVISSVRDNDTRYHRSLASTNLPVKPRSLLKAGLLNYYVTVGLGTPTKSLSLEIDTGSDLTWTQCLYSKPNKCYDQKDPIFDPSTSSSFVNVTCPSTYCSLVKNSGCWRRQCTYSVAFADKSFSHGGVASETLTLTPTDVISNFIFGCGYNNKINDGTTAGLLGLGRGKSSIVEQTANKYNRLFSYCIPKTSSSTGFLIFGGTSSKASKALYTPLKDLPASKYNLDLSAITIAGVQLDVPASTWTFIDSGSSFTYLPKALRSPPRSEFMKQMAMYPRAPSYADDKLDACYDVRSAGSSATFPKMSFTLSSGEVLDLLPVNILFFINSDACFAFLEGPDNSIQLGNTQHLGFEVVHDIPNKRIGFVPNAC